MKIRSNLFVKLMVWYAALLIFTITPTALILRSIFRNSLMKEVDATLFAVADDLWHTLEQPAESFLKAVEHEEEEYIGTPLYIQVLVIHDESPSQPVISFRSRFLEKSALPFSTALLAEAVKGKPFYVDHGADSDFPYPVRMIVFPPIAKGRVAYIVQTGISLKDVAETTSQFMIYMLVASATFLIIASAGGYFILSRALFPLRDVMAAARRITAENLSHRIDPGTRTDEIGELVLTFNGMLDRLERSVSHIRQFSSDVSHELKTPLTVISGEIEIALRKKRDAREYEEALRSILEEAYSLKSLINSLLLFSHLETQTGKSTLPTVMLDDLILKAIEKAQPLAQTKGIDCTIKNMEPVAITGDESLLHQMTLNLLDNAIKYTPAGGRIAISLTREDTSALLTVEDTGIGIPEQSLPYIFERFYRVDKSRSREGRCLGLGLSIVKRIVEYHDATIEVQSRLNHGSLFKISFPLPDA